MTKPFGLSMGPKPWGADLTRYNQPMLHVQFKECEVSRLDMIW